MPVALRFARIMHTAFKTDAANEISKKTIDAIAHEITNTIERDMAEYGRKIVLNIMIWAFICMMFCRTATAVMSLCHREQHYTVAREYTDDTTRSEIAQSLEDKSYPTRIPTDIS